MYKFSQFTYPTALQNLTTPSVNGHGQIAVTSQSGRAAAFLVSADGSAQSLASLDGYQSNVSDVNDSATVVGISSPLRGGGNYHATMWKDGRPTILPGFVGRSSNAAAINDAGIIAGWTYTRLTPYSGVGHAVWWDSTGVHELGAGGGVSSGAYGLNNHGTIVGGTRFADGQERGTIWKDGVVTHVGTLGGTRSLLSDVNDRGWAIGDSMLFGDEEIWHAMLWDGSSLRDLGTLGGRNSYSWSIGDDGTVFGSSDTISGQSHATIWRDGRATDLYDLVSNVTELGKQTMTSAIGADANGRIYGYLHGSNGVGTFVLTPIRVAEIPEPTTLALFVAALGALVASRRRSAI